MGLGRVEDGCMDIVFALRQVCEKYLANGKDVVVVVVVAGQTIWPISSN